MYVYIRKENEDKLVIYLKRMKERHVLFITNKWDFITILRVFFISCVLFIYYFSRLFIAALWSTAGKGLTFVMVNRVFVTFPCGILGQVWYLILSIPELCRLSYIYHYSAFSFN